MIIYNKEWLNNLYLHQQAEQLRAEDCLTAEEVKAIKEKYPVGFYTPGVFIRIGLFLLTCIILLFSFGLLSLMFESAHIIDGFGWPLFLGAVCVIALIITVKQKNHYRSGVDDALLWIGAGLLTGAFAWLVYSLYPGGEDHFLALSIFVFILSLYFTLRFADVIIGAVTCLSFFAVLFFAWKNLGSFGNATMPFIMIVAAAIVYVMALRLSVKINLPYYSPIITDIQLVSLLILYAAGNYLLVDQLNNMINNVTATGIPSKIPLGWFFWIWTMLLPLLYIARGIIKKDVITLRIGLLLCAAAIYTFRCYYHILNIELALLIGGIILFAVTYSLIRYLKTPKHGFTYADINNIDNLKLESLITAETLGRTPHVPNATENRFGGGDFGGGGSGGGF